MQEELCGFVSNLVEFFSKVELEDIYPSVFLRLYSLHPQIQTSLRDYKWSQLQSNSLMRYFDTKMYFPKVQDCKWKKKSRSSSRNCVFLKYKLIDWLKSKCHKQVYLLRCKLVKEKISIFPPLYTFSCSFIQLFWLQTLFCAKCMNRSIS